MEESRLTVFRQSYFGSAAAFCRIVTTALCALCLFLPVASYSVKIPMFIRNLSVSLKGAYDIIKSGEIEELTAMGRSTLLSDMTEKAMLVFGIFLLLALTVFTVIAFFIFSSLGVSTASRFMAAFSFGGAALAAFLQAFILIVAASARFPSFVSAEAGWGAAAACAALLLNGLLNLRVMKSLSLKEGEVSGDD